MRCSLQALSLALFTASLLSACQTTREVGPATVEYAFESDAAAHVFYQAIIDRTTLPLQTKMTYIDTPILVVETTNQVSAASITSEAAAEADTDGDLTITEAEAKAFADSSD